MHVCGTRSNLLAKYHYEGGGGSEREKRGKGIHAYQALANLLQGCPCCLPHYPI